MDIRGKKIIRGIQQLTTNLIDLHWARIILNLTFIKQNRQTILPERNYRSNLYLNKVMFDFIYKEKYITS
jgi:hypothetical protein